jgi:hypothetical protein
VQGLPFSFSHCMKHWLSVTQASDGSDSHPNSNNINANTKAGITLSPQVEHRSITKAYFRSSLLRERLFRQCHYLQMANALQLLSTLNKPLSKATTSEHTTKHLTTFLT